MRLVDTFLFSEAYEAELLLTKLVLEAPLISEFVLVESDVTFRGEFKGLQARKLVETDERFATYRDKIVFVEHEGRFFDGPSGYETFYENEERSRAAVMKHVLSNYEGRDWVIVSDVDEAFDCVDDGRRQKLLDHMLRYQGVDATLFFGHYRYWYDFDNRCWWTGICTPMAQLQTMVSGKSSTRCRCRPVANRIDIKPGNAPLCFEYTHCFPADAIWKKLNSFIHDGYTVEELEKALATNHWVKARARGEYPGQRGHEDWFETVELTEQNSPTYVRENLAKLKTNVIPADYRDNRYRLYKVNTGM